MTENSNKAALEQGVWFVYDGDCPLCSHAALALKLKHQYGSVHLLDARQNHRHLLLTRINKLGFDLDEGMVLYHQGHYYHGQQALQFMAQSGQAKGYINLMYKSLFWSKSLTKLTYPWMRGIRNRLIRRRHVAKIDNLQLSHKPIFQKVFANDWPHLPPVLKQHYQARCYSKDRVQFQGEMDIQCSGPFKWLSPLIWLMAAVPPKSERNIPAEVSFISDPDNLALIFHRVFHFSGKKPYQFRSKLYPMANNEVVEVMRWGFAWRFNILWQDERIKMIHRGYGLKWFGHVIPLPLKWLLGRAYAEEIAVDDERFNMLVTIKHPWWGTIYEYKGQFSLTAASL